MRNAVPGSVLLNSDEFKNTGESIKCIFVLLGELFPRERTAVVFLLWFFEALCHWCTTAQPLLQVALSPPCVCLRGGFFVVVVGGCEGLFLCLFFSWPYSCVPHCVGQCPTVTTFLLKIYFSGFHVCRIFVNFKSDFFFFFSKSVMWFFAPPPPASNKAVKFLTFLALGETSELQLPWESQDKFVFCDILEESRYQDESSVWKDSTTSYFYVL